MHPDFAANGVEFLTVDSWKRQNWLLAGFSTRIGGAMQASHGVEDAPGELNLGFTPEGQRGIVEENRLRFAEAVSGHRGTPLVTVKQVHSNRIWVEAEVREGTVPEADGIVTNRPGILLGVLTADCVPVLIADPVKRVVGAFHAGWRGTMGRIVEVGVSTMSGRYGSNPGDLLAAIGIAIGPCCYVVGEDVHSRFESCFDYAGELFTPIANEDKQPAWSLDLAEANRRQLLTVGLAGSSITMLHGCTCCEQHRYYSHRGSGGRAGRMMAVVGIR